MEPLEEGGMKADALLKMGWLLWGEGDLEASREAGLEREARPVRGTWE